MKLIKSIAIPLIGGIIIGLLSNTKNYNLFVPSIIFPIVWTILYILMGISSYIIKENNGPLNTYYKQLIINYSWPLIFFNLNLKTFALIILIILIALVIQMIKEFKKIDKTASYLQIPYLLWLFFAAFLNIISIIK